MVLLDTNVLSEQFQANPNKGVLAWLNDQALETLYLSVMTVAEIRAGVAVMPQGKRKKLLSEKTSKKIFYHCLLGVYCRLICLVQELMQKYSQQQKKRVVVLQQQMQ
ncbi:hypothetical protein Nstercoris_00447 [Nitrosomonas stercoris]|uniref:PIN domain-containing protein n=1 Tax=Nitrosomonas stercoris TaxID=1444684 RepID=A0A4Y1YJH5_9PROT|nr:hypothetical protein Nstercoris_00447 [Nitrosomonas stercoris]